MSQQNISSPPYVAPGLQEVTENWKLSSPPGEKEWNKGKEKGRGEEIKNGGGETERGGGKRRNSRESPTEASSP